MAITIKEKKGACTIRHGTQLTAIEATELKELLTETFDNYHDITLEFTDLNDCDTLGVQLLLSANKSAKIMNSRFYMKGDIEALRVAAEGIGLNFKAYFNQTDPIA